MNLNCTLAARREAYINSAAEKTEPAALATVECGQDGDIDRRCCESDEARTVCTKSFMPEPGIRVDQRAPTERRRDASKEGGKAAHINVRVAIFRRRLLMTFSFHRG